MPQCKHKGYSGRNDASVWLRRLLGAAGTAVIVRSWAQSSQRLAISRRRWRRSGTRTLFVSKAKGPLWGPRPF